MSRSSDAKLAPYKPEPLGPGQIRLLYVQHCESDDKMVCAIHHTIPIEDDYIAISYAWRTPFADEATVDIPLIDAIEEEIDDNLCLVFGGEPTKYLRVTETMRKMIKAVGLPDEEEPPLRAVWIDQISINQSDMSEKTEQVKMMHRVYQHAQRTIIYLGDPTDKTLIGLEAAYALAFLVGIPDQQRPYYVEKYQSPNIRRVEGLKLLDWPAIQVLPGYKVRHAQFMNGEDRLPLTPFHDFAMDILGRKWFNRTWVMQEIVCSKEAEIVIGKYKLPWDICVEACTFAGRLGFTRSFLIHTIASEIPLIEEIRQHRRTFMEELLNMDDEDTVFKYIRSVVYRSWPKILPKVIFKGVTDPRDKIFAMLNITSDLLFYNKDGRFSNLIDYESPIRIVYIRACELWHAGSDSQFDHLFPGDSARELSYLDWVLSSTDENNLNVPSWVPNWVQRGPAAIAEAGPKFTAGISEDVAVKPHVVFPSANQFSWSEVPLQVRGAVLSSVYRVAVVSCNNWKTDHIAEHAKALSLFSDPYPTTAMSYAKVWCTLTSKRLNGIFFFFLIKHRITKDLIFALYTFYLYSPSLNFYSRSFSRY
jgi:hypothetical protein